MSDILRSERDVLSNIASLIESEKIISGLEISSSRPIGQAILWANTRITKLEEAIKEDEEIERSRSKPIIEWTEEQMRESLECSDEKVWGVFIEMTKRSLRYYKNELTKCLLRDDVLNQYIFHVRLKIKELEVIIGKDDELRRRAGEG